MQLSDELDTKEDAPKWDFPNRLLQNRNPGNGASAIVSKELAAKEDAQKLDFPNSLQQKRLQMRLPR